MSQTTTAVLEAVRPSETFSTTQYVPKLRAVASVVSLGPPKVTNDAEVEMTDLAPTPSKDVQDLTQPAESLIPWWRPHAQFASLCWAFYVAGWNDGTTGALLPRIQSHYEVGYTVVSLIFISNFLGFLIGAFASIHLFDRYGFGVSMALGASTLVAAYALQAPALPFPVFVISYAIVGFGLALQEAGANSYVASLKKNGAAKMGILHSVYGAGAFCSPLSATRFAHIERWSFQFLTSLGLALIDAVCLMAIFRFKTQEESLLAIGQPPDPESKEQHEENNKNKYRQIFSLWELHLLAIFILVTVGFASSIGGWTVTYIITVRGGGPSSGYISSGFYGGITLGRVALIWVNNKLGERRAIFIYIIIAAALELVVWLVPSLVGGAIGVAFIGFITGPLFPLVMRHASKILPPHLLTGCVGWIAGFGQAGAAFVPFLTGAIASKKGIEALQPLLIGMLGLMLIVWALVPRSRRLD